MEAWEKTLAATVVHGINALVNDLDLALTSSADYAFSAHARHWSDLKGLALAFQFTPSSPLSAEAFATLHELRGHERQTTTLGTGLVQAHDRRFPVLQGQAQGRVALRPTADFHADAASRSVGPF